MSDQTQANTFSVAENTVDKVLAEVEAGTITAQDALAQEEERGEEARTSLVAKLKAIINPPTKNDAPVPAGKVRVRVAPKRTAKGAAYYDPAQRITIGEKPVSVERTPFVTRLLLSGDLEEA